MRDGGRGTEDEGRTRDAGADQAQDLQKPMATQVSWGSSPFCSASLICSRYFLTSRLQRRPRRFPRARQALPSAASTAACQDRPRRHQRGPVWGDGPPFCSPELPHPGRPLTSSGSSPAIALICSRILVHRLHFFPLPGTVAVHSATSPPATVCCEVGGTKQTLRSGRGPPQHGPNTSRGLPHGWCQGRGAAGLVLTRSRLSQRLRQSCSLWHWVAVATSWHQYAGPPWQGSGTAACAAERVQGQ